MALSALLPSGAEIGTAVTETASEPASTEGETTPTPAPTPAANPNALSYQDVRDHLVLGYFDLSAGESKSIKIRLNAAFLGKFHFPAISSEAMYQPTIRARTAGLPVQIVKSLPLRAEAVPAGTTGGGEGDLTN